MRSTASFPPLSLGTLGTPPSGRPSPGPLPQAVANLSGVWEGTLLQDDTDIGVPFSLVHGGPSEDGAAAGVLTFPARGEVPPVAVQLLEASATTYVALAGPYFDPKAAAELVIVLEGRTVGDRLYGTFRTRPVSGGRVTEGRFVAARSQRAAA